jgi:hypothetical protein
MTMQEKRFEEWLERAFRLAFFLHGDRETAKRIATSAMNKLETASNAQFKRYYYQPTGRAENSRASRSRVSLSDLQLLQRLVFVESEKFERAKEVSENISEQSLLKFFIKHLIRIALKRNSFYVTLAVSRILHNYATAEAMEIYNIVVQDPERVHDDYYYRSRKGILMKELRERFDTLLETVKVNRGEERFQTKTDDEYLSETAQDALEIFSPWNSECAIPEKFNPFQDIIKPFHFDKKDPDEEHRIEINRIHAAIHPSCFSRLTNALELNLPEEKMEIPKFMINTNNTDFDDHDWRNPPPLESDELEQIKEILNANAENRKAMTTGFLRVVVDGAERAQIDAEKNISANLTLDESAEFIEIYDERETLLANHLLSFGELQKGKQTQVFQLENGKKITFDLAPVLDSYGEVSEINFAVGYEKQEVRENVFGKINAFFATLIAQPFLKPALSFGLIILILVFGWLILRNSNKHNEVVVNPSDQNQNIVINKPENLPENKNEQSNENSSAPKNSNNALPKKEETEKPGEKKPKLETEKEETPRKKIVVENPSKELLATNTNKHKNSETKSDDDKILRLPIRETNQKNPEFRRMPEENTRNTEKRLVGKRLNEIKKIYIEVTGDVILGKQIAEQISNEIRSAGRFEITNDKESADAALKLYIRHESDVDTPEEKIVTAVVRLVNAEGFVVYPNRRKISGWKYVGEIARLPKRIADDLNKAK